MKKRILMIGPFPNPISGVSLANKIVAEILENEVRYCVKKINTSFTSFDEQIGKFSLDKALFYFKLNINLYKILKSDIIYITPGQTFFGLTKYSLFIILAKALKKELIIHVHGNHLGNEYKSLTGFKKKIFFYLNSCFTKGIVLSSSLKDNLLPFMNSNAIYSLPNFAQEYLYEKNTLSDFSKLKIVFLSNLMREKGIIELLKALIKIENENQISYEARLAGNIDENSRSEIEEYIKQLKNTKYIGVVSGEDKKELLCWSNIFVLPTFYKMEGQPISILEAMATNNLIVTTEHAGIPDVVKNETHGFFVKKQDADSIVEVLNFLNNNKEVLKEVSLTNRDYFLTNFTLKIFKEKLLKIID